MIATLRELRRLLNDPQTQHLQKARSNLPREFLDPQDGNLLDRFAADMEVVRGVEQARSRWATDRAAFQQAERELNLERKQTDLARRAETVAALYRKHGIDLPDSPTTGDLVTNWDKLSERLAQLQRDEEILGPDAQGRYMAEHEAAGMVAVADTEPELHRDARLIRDDLPELQHDQAAVDQLRAEVERGVDPEEVDARQVRLFHELMADNPALVLRDTPDQIPTLPTDIAARLTAQGFLQAGGEGQ